MRNAVASTNKFFFFQESLEAYYASAGDTVGRDSEPGTKRAKLRPEPFCGEVQAENRGAVALWVPMLMSAVPLRGNFSSLHRLASSNCHFSTEPSTSTSTEQYRNTATYDLGVNKSWQA